MAKVRVALGATVNYGNFESGRFDFEVTDDVRSDETVDEAVLRIEQMVEEHLVRRMKEEQGAKRGS